MDLAHVETIARAVLYEGYMLYPYRPTALKNRQRWSFGGVFPRAYCEKNGGETWTMQSECLALADAAATLDVRVRFLRLLEREIGALTRPVEQWPEHAEPPFRRVEALELGERRLHSMQEGVEVEVLAPGIVIGELLARPQQFSFAFPARREIQPLQVPDGAIVGVLVRRQEALAGKLELEATNVDETAVRITARVQNLSAWDSPGARDTAQLRSFASTHMVLGLSGGEFVSLIDPPERLRAAAAGCHNLGAWPVLVGQPGTATLMLAAPIILYDYPQIAPESPGDLFDGTEIDELLSLCILAMTDDEKREMAAADERTRALLERTEALSGEALLMLHGALR